MGRAGAGCGASGWDPAGDEGPAGLPAPLDVGRRRGLSQWQLRAGDCGSFINPELTPQFLSPEKQGEKFGFLVMRKEPRGCICFAYLFISYFYTTKYEPLFVDDHRGLRF